jgi:hypothetical protein
MGIREKMKYVLDHPGAFPEYFALEKRLAGNRRRGIRNFLFQCDAKGHFPYLKPYIDALKDRPDVDIFLTGADLDGEVGEFLRRNGVRPDRIIRNSSLVRLTEWDIYMSPTSWGNVFPKNQSCPRIQIFHTMADKNIQYGENLLKFDVIFVCGPVHHEFLRKYLFDPSPTPGGNAGRSTSGTPRSTRSSTAPTTTHDCETSWESGRTTTARSSCTRRTGRRHRRCTGTAKACSRR